MSNDSNNMSEKKYKTYPDVERGSTSGHDRRLLQNANGGRSCGDGWWTGDTRCWRNEPLRGGAKHSKFLDCLRIEPWLDGGVIVPGAGTTFGNPTEIKYKTRKLNSMKTKTKKKNEISQNTN